MSGRRFRILSDSEDEEAKEEPPTLPSQQPVDERVVSDSNLNDEPVVTRKKRTRIVTNDSSDDNNDHDDDVENANNSSNEPASQLNSRRVEVRSSSRNEPDENLPDGSDSDGGHSGGHRSDESRPGGNRSDGNQSDGNRSDESRPDGNRSVQERSADELEGHERPADEREDHERPAARDDEAEEAPERKIVKKRVVKNPQPKLDAVRLTGERGLGRLRNMYSRIHLKGKGQEREDLKCVLHNLQLWGHQMFPKMQTKDIFERCERLGNKMPVRVHLRRMRNGEINDFNKPVIESDEDVARGVGENHEPVESPNNEIIGEEEEEPPVLEESRDLFQELLNSGQPESTEVKPTNQDAELMAKIQAKKLEALKRREQLKAQRETQQMEELEAQRFLEMEALNSASS